MGKVQQHFCITNQSSKELNEGEVHTQQIMKRRDNKRKHGAEAPKLPHQQGHLLQYDCQNV